VAVREWMRVEVSITCSSLIGDMILMFLFIYLCLVSKLFTPNMILKKEWCNIIGADRCREQMLAVYCRASIRLVVC